MEQEQQKPTPRNTTDSQKGKVMKWAIEANNFNWCTMPDNVQRVVFQCAQCSEWITEEAVQCDHFPTPTINGGETIKTNTRILCAPCNAGDIHNKLNSEFHTRKQLEERAKEAKYYNNE